MSPNEADCLWLYLKDDIPTLDQFSSRVEQDRAARVTAGVSVCLVAIQSHRLGLDRIDYHVIIVTPTGYLI